MNNIITFDKKQLATIAKNKNVLRCKGKYIYYTKTFKIKAVKQYLEGMHPNQIFAKAGFDLDMIGKPRARYLLFDWLKIFNTKGVSGFVPPNRGRPRLHKKIKLKHSSKIKLSDKEKIKRLQLEVQYLRKENDFLATLRAKKAE